MNAKSSSICLNIANIVLLLISCAVWGSLTYVAINFSMDEYLWFNVQPNDTSCDITARVINFRKLVINRYPYI
uniref:Uncharacterized protein n=1 Tax=Trichuris muris TaxID=70415 RepID=A0A5S6QB27_TRIMR